MTLIDTIYIHNSGGKTLLEVLIKKILQTNLNSFFFLFDSRLDNSVFSKVISEKFKILKASEHNRIIFYKKNQKLFKHFFCFANVPPPIQLKKPVTIYFHNDLIIDTKNSGIGLIKKLEFLLKKNYIQYKNQNDYNWIVQTKLIKNKLNKKLKIKSQRISILPFFKEIFPVSKKEIIPNTFFYVANYTNNKNHKKLIQAFQDAALKTNQKITLKLTLTDRDFKILKIKTKYSISNFELINLGILKKKPLIEAYQETNFFIYPSLKESFGLPLIEATNFPGYVLAPDLPYVHEVISPSITFNPHVKSEITAVILNVLNLKNLERTELKVKNKIKDLITHITHYV